MKVSTRSQMNITTRKPILKYKVLATDWEAETYIECWTENLESAKIIAKLLQVRDVSVQIDQYCETNSFNNP